jgi:hypothetical protein
VGHAHPVRLEQEVVDEVGAEVEVLQPGEQRRAPGLRPAQAMDGPRIGDGAPEQRAPLRRPEDLLEGEMGLERRQMRRPSEALELVVERDAAVPGGQPLGERRQCAGGAAEPGGEEPGGVGLVAAEQLVPALPGEHDLHVLGGEPGDEVGRQRRGVAERLVRRRRDLGEQPRRVRPDDELVVVRAVAAGDKARPIELVERALLEADREGLHRIPALLRRERRQRRGVDPAGQQDADGHVRDEMGAHAVAQAVAQLRGEHRRRLGARDGRGPRAAPARDLDAPGVGVPREPVAGRQLARRGGRPSSGAGIELKAR